MQNRAVKRLIMINRIQNKSLCLHNICVRSVYNYFVYMCTCMYMFKKYLHVYIYIYTLQN